jgi:phosphatidate cytidylyltransferase
MRQRVISGVIGSVLLVAALLAPPFVLMLVALAASLIAILEFRQAAQSVQREVDPLTAVIMTVMLLGNARFSYPESYGDMLRAVETWPVALRELGTLALSAAQFVFSGHAVRVVAFACILWLFGRLVFQHGRFHLDDLAMTITAVLYIPFLMSFVAQVRGLEHGAWLIWCVAIGAIITDTACYFSGVTLGRRKLLPDVSPKKTVEGAIGGVIGCMVIMTGFGFIVPQTVRADVPWYHFLLLGLLCGLISQLGDWSASAIKRSAGIKDFGKLIPGHGGILDRLDSILFVAPAVYLYLRAIGGL